LTRRIPPDQPGWAPLPYLQVDLTLGLTHGAGIVQEAELRLLVNGKPLTTLTCSPIALSELILGYLFNAGAIDSVDELLDIVWSGDGDDLVAEARVAIRGDQAGTSPPQESGVAGTGTDPAPLLALNPESIIELMTSFSELTPIYDRVRGIHAAALVRDGAIHLVAEDIGRHNTLDRIAGRMLLESANAGAKALLTSGRITGDMVVKAQRMQIPCLISRSSATDRAVRLARQYDICLIGYVRPQSLRIYSGTSLPGYASIPKL
jgi:FdhD protein